MLLTGEIEHVLDVGPEHATPSGAERKHRGAFFTPPAIAHYLAAWAIAGRPGAKVLDPTCGDGAFLVAAADALRSLGISADAVGQQLYGVDLHRPSIDRCAQQLSTFGAKATLRNRDFFELDPPDGSLFAEPGMPMVDAVIGNPPFVRYQHHAGDARRLSQRAALRQGVRLSGLASSWAALLVHACGFLKPSGRLAMVLPTELLTVGYAEPIRAWLRRRFGTLGLVFFEKLQFAEALEDVVLLLAGGTGGTEGFMLHGVSDSDDLEQISPFTHYSVPPPGDSKWTSILLRPQQRRLFQEVVNKHCAPLADFGQPELGTVTGANDYFVIDEATRLTRGLLPDEHLCPTAPPGTRYLQGLSLTKQQWRQLRDQGERVWLLWPRPGVDDPALRDYVAAGEAAGVDQAYKCTIRAPWWRPPRVSPPDLFFTYMSHRYPRMITNTAGVTFLNSMHGMRLKDGPKSIAKQALPLIAFNSITMLGAETLGRWYGGGILKMEPREAGRLPLPKPDILAEAWEVLESERDRLERQLQNGNWTTVLARVDEVLLRNVLRLSEAERVELHEGARSLRSRRMDRTNPAL